MEASFLSIPWTDTICDRFPNAYLTKIVGPSPESRQAGNVKKNFTERHKLREQYWEGLLEVANERTDLHANVSSSKYSWLGTGAGHSGIKFNYKIRQHAAWAEFYIDHDKDTGEENVEIFDSLFESRDEIEESFGGELDWRRLEDKRACRILTDQLDVGYRDQEQWEESYDPLVDRMIRLESALRPHIQRLEL